MCKKVLALQIIRDVFNVSTLCDNKEQRKQDLTQSENDKAF